VAKPELGTKRVCAGCNLKFYDLHKTPIVCPTCGVVFVVPKPAPARPPRRVFERPTSMPVVAVAEQAVLEDDANLEDTVPDEADALVAEEEKVGDEDADAGVPVLEDMDEE
jgi:uncharacterized protein (TIGR02300 family)